MKLFCLLLSASLLHAASKASVELVLVEPGGKAGTRRMSISRKAAPGPGKELRVLVVGSAESLVSVVALTKKGDLVSVPEVTTLTAGKARELPEGARWNWDVAEKVSDVYVILAPQGAGDFAAYRTLVSKMNDSANSAELRRLQTSAVVRWIESQLKSPTSAADYSMKAEPTPMGGLIRGTEGFGAPVDVPDGRSVVMRIRLEP